MFLNATPKQIVQAYASGNTLGCFVDAEGIPEALRRRARYAKARLLERLRYRFVSDAVRPGFMGAGRGKRGLPWRAYLALCSDDAMKGNQLRGDCVSWGTGTAVDIERATAILDRGQYEEFRDQRCTAGIYCHRGFRGEGMVVSTAFEAIKKHGFIVEGTYCNGKYNLTNYKDYYQLPWVSAGRGLPTDLEAECKPLCKINTISYVQTTEEVMDLLYTGRGVSVGSSITAGTTGNPISKLQTPAGHCEAIIGYDDTDEIKARLNVKEAVFIWDQSWGNWNTVTNWPDDLWGPRPEGAFVLTATDTQRKLGQGEALAATETDGFTPRQIDWMMI